MNTSPRAPSRIGAWLRRGATAACLCAAPFAHAYAQALLLFPEGTVTLIRGTSVFEVDTPLVTQPGDILTTDTRLGAQLEDGNGMLAALGPQTRLTIDAPPRGADASGAASLSLLTGWIKLARSAAPGQWLLDTPTLRVALQQGSSAIHATSTATALFVETGSAAVTLPETRDAPQTLGADRYLAREFGKPAVQSARPAAVFVSQLPLTFRDPLAPVAAHAQTRPATPTQGRPVAYEDVADWLACGLAVRRTFVLRFRPLAHTEPFRTQIRLNLHALPEWRPVLYPPPPLPPRRPSGPRLSAEES